MELTMIAGGPRSTGDDDNCNAGDSPTVFATDRPDMLAVQGYDVAHRTPMSESVVLLPEEILKEAARARGWL